MFDSKTLSREELEVRYEQASVILGVLKGMVSEESFQSVLMLAAYTYTKLRAEAGEESNLPPGWMVYNGKR